MKPPKVPAATSFTPATPRKAHSISAGCNYCFGLANSTGAPGKLKQMGHVGIWPRAPALSSHVEGQAAQSCGHHHPALMVPNPGLPTRCRPRSEHPSRSMWRERLSPGTLFKSLDLRAAGAQKLSGPPPTPQGLDWAGSVLVRHELWAGSPSPPAR